MPESPRGTISTAVGEFAQRLRFPQLFTVVLVIFLVDLVVPDMIPFLDEILFGLLTVLLGSLKKDDAGGHGERRTEKDVTPKRR